LSSDIVSPAQLGGGVTDLCLKIVPLESPGELPEKQDRKPSNAFTNWPK